MEKMISTPAKGNKAAVNRLFYGLTTLSAYSIVILFAGILYCLFQGSLPAIKAFGLHFLVDRSWDPVQAQFGAAGAIAGTLITSAIALAVAVPVSFGVTVFIVKIAPFGMRRYLRVAVDLLAGIPSIIYGMWGLFALAPLIGNTLQPWLSTYFGSWFSGSETGIGLFTAGIVLGIMITPFIASIIHDIFDMVPRLLLDSCYALGATSWETFWNIILPYGKIGFIGGIMLGLGRAIGETMAVAFVIGNAHTMTTTLFEPANSITSTLANEFTEATQELYTSSLIELGLYLFLITTIVIFFSRVLLHLIQKRQY